MKIGVIGTGGVGGYFGSLLVRCGLDVHFLLKNDFDHVRHHGLKVDSKNGDFAVKPINAYCKTEDMPVCDMVIIALKTTENSILASVLPEIIHENTTLVVLQNGLDIEKDLSEMVPGAAIIGGICFLCSSKVGPGHIRHLDHGSIRLGEYLQDQYAVGISPALRAVADIFSRAGIPVQLTDNITKARWEKLVWNMGFNGPAVVLNATTHEIINDASSRGLVYGIMEEVVRGAIACGFDIDAEFPDLMMSATRRMVDYSPSMRVDYAAHKPMEVESIYWRPIRIASGHGFEMQKSQVIAYQLDFLGNSLKEKFEPQIGGAI